MKEKVYVVGSITGDEKWERKFEKAISKISTDYFVIMSPLDYPKGLTQEEYMKLSVNYVFLCDWLCVIDGWEKSKGTSAEIALAKSIRKKIEYGY